MKTRLFTVALAVGATALSLKAGETDIASYPGYSLAFAEEFDEGDAPDPDKWTFESGFCRNHEDQIYCRENATVKDGLLIIEARKEQTLNPNYKKYSTDWKTQNQYGDYSSASIILKDPYKFHYGIYEVKAKIPVGTGYWPAIWGCGNHYEWPYNGELDIMEYYGNAIHANLAWGGSERWNAQWASKAPKMNEFEGDFADKYHIWRCEWDYSSCRIYLDDRLLNEVDLDRTVNTNPGQSWYNVDGYNPYRDPENKFGVWLNLALGGDNGGSLANTPFPAQYLVDYVRVYTPDAVDSPLVLRISKAEKVLAQAKQEAYPSEAFDAFRAAMDAAKAKLGAKDDQTVDEAVENLQKAMDSFIDSMINPCAVGGTYTFHHTNSGCILSTGWMDGKECVLLLQEGQEGYNQEFTLAAAPDGAKADGFNIRTGDGKYVYRDSWNLYVTSDASKLIEKDYLFNIETADGKLVIKNFGSGKYFGVDSSSSWAHVYSDKPGKGNRAAYFELPEDNSGIAALFDASGVNAVYTLQGVRIADRLSDLDGNRRGEMLIVIENGRSKKVVF